jgi:DNA polymerase I
MNKLVAFREIVTLDFEFVALPGERPVPRCCVAHELKSGRRFRLWEEDLRSPAPPFAQGPDVLFVAYFACADLGCYRVLGWPIPERILDPFVEFRCHTNGRPPPHGASLLGALAYFGIDSAGASADYKNEMQGRFGRGEYVEREEGLDYCERDVFALDRLLPVLEPYIDLPRALLRGRYMAAAAAMEFHGVPIDVPMLAALREHWTSIQDALIAEIDRTYHVFDGRTFKLDRFEAFLARAGIPWSRLESGRLDLSDSTFRDMAKAYPTISPLRELRSSLADLRLESLRVGHDGRNRALLSPFRAKTGRNQPSNAGFIFGPSV